ncbi:MAG TPA: type II toxin-antitoxin system death-on-curing family toxin [Pyrinomonadaceae bacterium]|nr:type II toxin-antitoxin system death-on-curing family toxin [Pyrinomonadaceae bacterium]
MRKFYYLTTEEAITLHILLMREWNEIRFGVDRRDLLESALNRPKQTANFENADIIGQAATLCFGLIKSHPWLGGNKRTATYLTEVFLDLNGVTIKASDREIVSLALNIESDTGKVAEIKEWLDLKTQKQLRKR